MWNAASFNVATSRFHKLKALAFKEIIRETVKKAPGEPCQVSFARAEAKPLRILKLKKKTVLENVVNGVPLLLSVLSVTAC
jgi:hypothetical protein